MSDSDAKTQNAHPLCHVSHFCDFADSSHSLLPVTHSPICHTLPSCHIRRLSHSLPVATLSPSCHTLSQLSHTLSFFHTCRFCPRAHFPVFCSFSFLLFIFLLFEVSESAAVVGNTAPRSPPKPSAAARLFESQSIRSERSAVAASPKRISRAAAAAAARAAEAVTRAAAGPAAAAAAIPAQARPNPSPHAQLVLKPSTHTHAHIPTHPPYTHTHLQYIPSPQTPPEFEPPPQ